MRAARSDCTTQGPGQALRIMRLLLDSLFWCLRRTRLERKIDRKSGRKSPKIQPRSTQNRRKIDLEPFRAPKAVSGTRPDAPETAFGHPNAGPKAILERFGRAKNGQEPSKSVPEPPRRRSQTLLECRPSASGTPSGLERAFGPTFGRFCLVARKLRCASRISFYSVLLGSHEVDTERA